MEILRLHREGLSNRHIGKRLGIDRRTVKRYIADPSFFGTKKQVERTSIVEPYKDMINRILDEDVALSAMWIYNKLSVQGYPGSYERIKLYVRGLKEERHRIAYVRFETEPGYQAQVDFAEFVVDRSDGTQRKYYLFIMVLGFSRMLYVELLERCDLTSFLDAHIRAFEFFGGVPREILYDRMKNVYIRRVAGKDQFNRMLVGMAVHYGFTPRVAPPYSPWVKGKVERPIPYVRENFWRGYSLSSLERANIDLLAWSKQSSQRVHGTTHERVYDRFDREKPALGNLPAKAFDTSYPVFRTIHKDCTICFDGNRYVAPYEFVGKKIVLRVKNETIRLFHDDLLLAEYAVAHGKGALCDPHGVYDRLRNDRVMNRRKFADTTQNCGKGRARQTISPSVPAYACVAVERRMIDAYAMIGGEVAYE